MNARSCARFFALIANGGRFNDVRLLSEERVWSFTQLRDNRYEVDAVLQAVCWIGVGGYWVGGDSPPLLPIVGTSPHILHHPGIGGSIGWADLDTQLSVAICHNWMHPLDALENPLMPVADAIRTVAAEIRG
jgi:CubicO group peptidase (beta-lactamase class C family)